MIDGRELGIEGTELNLIAKHSPTCGLGKMNQQTDSG